MEALIIHCICANQNCYGLGVSFLPFLSYGDFSEVINLKHGNLTMHRSVEVQLRSIDRLLWGMDS